MNGNKIKVNTEEIQSKSYAKKQYSSKLTILKIENP
jgi:hypothetical protein